MEFVKTIVGVLLAMTIVTTLALWWGRPSNHPQLRFQEYPADAKVIPLPELGAMLYEQKGCNTCHTIDGTPRVGPTFLHDFGSKATLADGSTITVDDAYLFESIERPQEKARPGYPPAMPAEYAKILSKRDKAGLVAYIKTLR